MKKIVLIVLMFFVSSLIFIYGQDYAYEVSEIFERQEGYTFIQVVEGEEILKLYHNSKKNKLIFKKINGNNFEVLELNDFENDLPENFNNEAVRKIGGHYYFFYSSWSGKKTKHERLYYRKISFEKAAFEGEPVLLISHKGKIVPFFADLNNVIGLVVDTPKFEVKLSQDSTKILVQYRKKPTAKKDVNSWDRIGFRVYDQNFKMLWNTEQKMPYSERRMEFIDYLVTNKGEAYVLSKIYHSNSTKDKKSSQINYHLELLNFNETNDKPKVTKVNLEDKYINEIKFYKYKEEIHCVGFYNNGKYKKNSTDGLFRFKFNEQGELLNKKFHEIPLEIMNQYEKAKTKKKNKNKQAKGDAEENNLILAKVAVNIEDGSVVLIGEKFYTKSHSSKMRDYYTYHYESMIASKIDANDNLAWMYKIPKRQMGRQPGVMSFKYFSFANKHYLLYVDNVNNLNLPKDEIPAKHLHKNGGYLTACTIDDTDGTVEVKPIVNLREIKEELEVKTLYPSDLIEIKERELFIQLNKRKEQDFYLKIKLQ